MASPTALHEATHAVVAHRLGLTVREVKLRGWTRIPRYCAKLYPGLVAGVPIRSPITLLEEDCLDVSPAEVLIALAAPSFIRTDDVKMNTYGELERLLAMRYAQNNGIDAQWMVDWACHYAASCERRIYRIADLLQEKGGHLYGGDLDYEDLDDGEMDRLHPHVSGRLPLRSVLRTTGYPGMGQRGAHRKATR